MGIQLDAHENDMEGVLEVVELPGRLGEPGFEYDDMGVLKALVTVFHLDFYSYRNTDIPAAEQYGGRDEDIDGKIRFKDWQGRPHPVTAQQSQGHGLKAWPQVDIVGGDGLVYYPAWEGQTEPSGPDDRDNLYRLVDIFEEGPACGTGEKIPKLLLPSECSMGITTSGTRPTRRGAGMTPTTSPVWAPSPRTPSAWSGPTSAIPAPSVSATY